MPGHYRIARSIGGILPGRAGIPDLTVYTFTGSDQERDAFYPIAEHDWIDADDVAPGTSQVVLRATRSSYRRWGSMRPTMDLGTRPPPAVFEVRRCLAAVHRDRVLARTEERRTRVPPDLRGPHGWIS